MAQINLNEIFGLYFPCLDTMCLDIVEKLKIKNWAGRRKRHFL